MHNVFLNTKGLSSVFRFLWKTKVVLCWNILSVSGFDFMKGAYGFEVFPTRYVLLKSVICEFAGHFDYFY